MPSLPSLQRAESNREDEENRDHSFHFSLHLDFSMCDDKCMKKVQKTSLLVLP